MAQRKNAPFSVAFLLLCLAWTTHCQRERLYSYGTENGDDSMPYEYDESVRLELTGDFPFFDKYYNHIYINENGVLSFDETVVVETRDPTDRALPIKYDADGDGDTSERPEAILPFWADVDITDGDRGNVYYRETTTNTALLQQATIDIQNFFLTARTFTARHVIIVTWKDVSFFDQQGSTDPRNTFQAVLISDGGESYVLFNYEAIAWTTGTNMEGNADTGLGTYGAAVIGFTGQKGAKNYEMDESSSSDDLILLPERSNIANPVAGVFAFRVDGNDIVAAACDSSNDVITDPAAGGMMGGEKVSLFGPCWFNTPTTCVFRYNGQELQRVNATIVNAQQAYCIPQPFFMVGEVDLEIQSGSTYSTTYSVLEASRIQPTVTRIDSQTDTWNYAGNSLVVQWDPDNFATTDLLTITVMAYREDGTDGPRWETVYTITNETQNDGTWSFTPTGQVDVTENNAFGIIRIGKIVQNGEHVLWSDIHTLGYILNDDYQASRSRWASDQCDAWASTDVFTDFTGTLVPCPCNVEQAVQDLGRFVADSTCNRDDSTSCVGNDEAKHCVYSAFPSDDFAGIKCCYDATGLLLYAGDTIDAGMSARSHVRGARPYESSGRIPELSHRTTDWIYRQFCCKWAGETECFQYRTHRPTIDCVGYEPPSIALTFGDPHFITWDRYNYTFNGLGEYTIFRYADGATGDYDFELQGRLSKSKDNTGNDVDATQLSAVAMAEMESDVIYIESHTNSGMNVYRRMQQSSTFMKLWFREQNYVDLQGCSVAVNNVNENMEIYGVTVMFQTTGIGVHVTYNYGMLAVTPILPPGLDGNRLYGLLGNMNANPADDLTDRGSNNALTDPTEEQILGFGQTWEIEVNYYLFYYRGGESHSDLHNSSFIPQMNVPITNPYQDCMSNEWCNFDYAVTQDRTLALATLAAYESYAEGLVGITKIPVCSYRATPLNGTKIYANPANRNYEGAKITFQCDGDLILVGSSTITCQNSAGTLTWTGSESNECLSSSCGKLGTPENGSLSFSEDMNTATFDCDDGYFLSGSTASTCSNGAWSNSAPTCERTQGTNVVGLAVGITVGVIVLIVAVVLGFLYYRKRKSDSTKSRPKTVDARDAELAEPLNKKPTDVRSSGKSTKSSDSTSPSAQIYKPTPIAQASVKYSSGGEKGNTPKPTSTNIAPAKEPVKETTKEPMKEPEVKPAVATVDEKITLKTVGQTEKSAPPSVAAKPKTPETLKKESPKQSAPPKNGSSAPSVGYKPSSRDAPDTTVQGVGLLSGTNIKGTDGWI